MSKAVKVTDDMVNIAMGVYFSHNDELVEPSLRAALQAVFNHIAKTPEQVDAFGEYLNAKREWTCPDCCKNPCKCEVLPVGESNNYIPYTGVVEKSLEPKSPTLLDYFESKGIIPMSKSDMIVVSEYLEQVL